MISIKKLKVKVGEKIILDDISLDFASGKNYLLLGKNGSGKSSLRASLMANPKYEIVSGNISIDNKNLLEMSTDERSRAGIFLSFQNVPEIPGVNLGEYLRIIYNIHQKQRQAELAELTPFVFKRFIKKYLHEFKIDESFLARDLNVGFSGGEKRKIEMLQIALLQPKYIILDEMDSGLDVDAFKIVAQNLSALSNQNNTFIIITHYFNIVDYFDIDKVYLLEAGKLKMQGAMEIVENIKQNGF